MDVSDKIFQHLRLKSGSQKLIRVYPLHLTDGKRGAIDSFTSEPRCHKGRNIHLSLAGVSNSAVIVCFSCYEFMQKAL